MAIVPETGYTPPVSAPEQPSDSPPAKSQSHAMEVDKWYKITGAIG